MKAYGETLTDDELLDVCAVSNTKDELYHNIGYSSADSVKKKNRAELLDRLHSLGVDKFDRLNKSTGKKTCAYCGAETSNIKYCSNQCYLAHRRATAIDKWKHEGNTNTKPESRVSKTIRDYIFSKQRGTCAICGIGDEWNGKKLVFVLDHINGDASDSGEGNIRLICPNCDSQLDTFKSKNKNSARKSRKKRNGRMSERFIEAVLKTVDEKLSSGSNPDPAAI